MTAFICVKCTGRLHQLFDFNILKLHIETTNADDQTYDPEQCSFCGTSGIMPEDHKLEAASAIAKTKWRAPVRNNYLATLYKSNIIFLIIFFISSLLGSKKVSNAASPVITF